ncbi:MAG: hypothetical protein F6K22_02410 [Okeania sp. SIO2F4]|uniref:hypothetical protein n=1 Tax=Okeania sp. SIO2F4 TaxID=2607790 RepID=UPI001428E092|nr:hypothetical protein [Okeania sp. SIO2F4]NES01776.1 hypothetical protein [Okeania sp. SIO2F4]
MKLQIAILLTVTTSAYINAPILNKQNKIIKQNNTAILEQETTQTSSENHSQFYVPYQIGTNVLEGKIPAWELITFESLPPFLTAGSWQSSESLDNLAGYSLSLEWEKGQNIASVLTLGDFQSSFKLHLLSLNSIFVPLSIKPESLKLADFPLLKNLDLGELVEAIPDLKIKKLEARMLTQRSANAPVADLIKTVKGSEVIGKTIGQVLEQDKSLKKLKLSQIQLSKYPITSIPRLDSTPLKFFPGWQSVVLTDIPYLKKLPFSFFPNPPTNEGFFALVKSINLIDKASNISSVSGGKNDGFEQNCLSPCQVISLGGSEFLSSRSWVESEQKVRGGKGFLAVASGGLESTGRHPYSDAFKVVLQPIDRVNVKINLYFRRENSEVGKSPYFIGPISLGTVYVGETVFLGRVESDFQSAKKILNSPRFDELEELDFLALQKAYEKVLGKFSLYSDLSPVVQSSNSTSGRLLGKYRFWSRMPEVRERIYSKNGANFLKELESGKTTSISQFLVFFSPEQQDFLFASQQLELFDLAREQIDPTTGKNFQGDRAIERVAQMYLGGIGTPIDSSYFKLEAEKIALNYSNYQKE